MRETWVRSTVGKMPWRRERLSSPVFWPGEIIVHGGAKSWTWPSDFHFHLYESSLKCPPMCVNRGGNMEGYDSSWFLHIYDSTIFCGGRGVLLSLFSWNDSVFGYFPTLHYRSWSFSFQSNFDLGFTQRNMRGCKTSIKYILGKTGLDKANYKVGSDSCLGLFRSTS